MRYPTVLTWPIAFAVWAAVLGVALAVARRRRRRSKAAAPVQARMSRPPAAHSEAVSDEPAYGSIYQIDPHPGDEGGENE